MSNKRTEDYFFTETHVNQSFVTFYRKYTKVVWACQLGLLTNVLRPEVVLGHEKSREYEKGINYVTIDFCEWSKFFANLSSIFRDNDVLRNEVIKRMWDEISIYEELVCQAEKMWNTDEIIHSEIVEQLFQAYSRVDTFAIFNHLVPTSYYEHIFEENGLKDIVTVDDFLVSLVKSHRTLVRENKLKLAKEMLCQGELCEESLSYYFDNIVAYDEFDYWLFDSDKLRNVKMLKKDIKRIIDTLGSNEIEKELCDINEKRTDKLLKMLEKINLVYTMVTECSGEEMARTIRNSLSLLPIIATEEEVRHMIECRHFALMGKCMKKLKIDVARSSTEEIIQSVQALWG